MIKPLLSWWTKEVSDLVRPTGFPPAGINFEPRGVQQKTRLTAGFLVRPTGFEPAAFRVGV